MSVINPGTSTGGSSFPQTAGTGYVCAGIGHQPPNFNGSASIAFNTTGKLYCFQTQILYAIIVRNVLLEVTTLEAATNAYLGVYSADGNTKLIDSGAMDSSATGIKNVVLGSPVTLNPGVYMIGGCSDSTTGTMKARCALSSATANTYNDFVNKNTARFGTSANALSGGVLPSALGVITKFTTASQTPIISLMLES